MAKENEQKDYEKIVADWFKLLVYAESPQAIFPIAEGKVLYNLAKAEIDHLPDVPNIKSLDQLFAFEAKSRLKSFLPDMALRSEGGRQTSRDIIEAMAVPQADFDFLKTWLRGNRKLVIDTNQRMYERFDPHDWRTRVPLGSTPLREQAEKKADEAKEIVASAVRQSLSHLPGIDQMFNDYLIIINSWENRSYMNYISQVASIAASAVTYMRDRKIFVDYEEMIRIFGHELIGHVRHALITKNSELPEFLKTEVGKSVDATSESIAQHFESGLFDYFMQHNTFSDKDLGQPYSDIYNGYKDKLLLSTYWRRIRQLGRLTLSKTGSKKLGEAEDILGRYSISKTWPQNFITEMRTKFDPVTNELIPSEVAELIYCARPVQRLIASARPEKVPEIESLILTGMWTPVGLEQWVKYNLNKS